MKQHQMAQAETALSYVLGVLEGDERQRFEGHLSECAACSAEVRSVAELASSLAIAVEPVAPPGRLRHRLLSAITANPARRHLMVVRSGAVPWKPAKTGVWEKPLFRDEVRRRAVRLIRLEPGANIPPHRHLGDEESFVLEGTARLGSTVFHPGDYHRAPAGSAHPSYFSAEGCVFLLFSGTEYEFFKEERQLPEPWTDTGSAEDEWKPLRSGVLARTLFMREKPAQATVLLKVEPGATPFPLTGSQPLEIFVLEGEAHVDSEKLSSGDYLLETAGSTSRHLQTDKGCLLLMRSCE